MEINATIISEKVTSNSKNAHDLFSSQGFGKRVGDKVFYSLVEAFYLISEKKMKLYDFKNKKLNLHEIEKKFEKLDKQFKNKYLVFKDLRKKGYIVKSALKFGAEFRVYEKGKKMGKSHSKWILFPVSEKSKLSWQEFSSKNRVAHSTKKRLLIAVVDDECDVSYFEINWTKP